MVHRIRACPGHGSGAEEEVVFLQHPGSFLVKCGVSIGLDEEAPDVATNVAGGSVGVPVGFKDVDTDFASFGHIGVEYSGKEATSGGPLGVFVCWAAAETYLHCI